MKPDTIRLEHIDQNKKIECDFVTQKQAKKKRQQHDFKYICCLEKLMVDIVFKPNTSNSSPFQILARLTSSSLQHMIMHDQSQALVLNFT